MKLFSRFTHSRLITDALREIRATRSRFLSILVLSALAVCFLAGLRATEPDMKNSADRYLDSLRLMDLRVAATLGLTDEDIALLSEQPGVQLCQGAYTIDAMVKTGEKDSNAKVLSYTEEINCPELLEGRLPQTPEECLAEPRFLQETGLSIGDTITLDTGTGDYEDALTGTQFTIAGTANSPLYIGVERGSSTLGTGKAEYFLLLPMESFAMESYTDAYLLVDGAAELMTYSDEYDQLIQSMTDQLEPLGEERAALRAQTVRQEGQEKIDEARQELADAEQELADAEQELADARQELDDGWADYTQGQLDYEDGLQEYRDGEQEYQDGLEEYKDGKKELKDGEEELEYGWDQLQDGVRQYNDALAKFEAGKAELEAREADWEAGLTRLREELLRAGVVLLEDRKVMLARQGACIQLLGLRDPRFAPKEHRQDRERVEKKLRELMGTEEDRQFFQLLLSHRPELMPVYADCGVDMVLCGHAHGGQFRLFHQGLFAPQQGLFPKYTGGVHVKGTTAMVISRGLGNSEFPLRLNNPPELVKITLHCQPPAEEAGQAEEDE